MQLEERLRLATSGQVVHSSTSLNVAEVDVSSTRDWQSALGSVAQSLADSCHATAAIWPLLARRTMFAQKFP